MRNWKQLTETNTLGEQMDVINQNSASSEFLDKVTSDIMANGCIFTGRETVGGKLILPLTDVGLSGVVPSEVQFDNFRLFFRDTNNIIELDRFPIDLIGYNNGKPQFLYIKENLSYRISDYMYGQSDEILLARFVINSDNTWNQLYIIPQRATAPLYHSGEEFYELDGLYVKSPGGLELSTTEGTVKRSGIDFADTVSPDIYHSFRLETQRVPIRYITTQNEIDYTKEPVYNIITDKMMTYNKNIKTKVKAEELIRGIKDLYHDIVNFANDKAEELHEAIVLKAELSDKQDIVRVFTDEIDHIYNQANNLLDVLMDESLDSVDKTKLAKNIDNLNEFLNAKLKGTAISIEVTEAQTVAIRQTPAYILDIDSNICDNPLCIVLQDILDELAEIVYPAGSIEPVPEGKFTIQRILWDVYEDCFIIQYGNKIYDTFNEAADSSGLMDFPAPYGKTIYIPMAILIIKSGITDLNDDIDSVLVTRRWVHVDQSYDLYSDIVARAKADMALEQIQNIVGGVTPVGKANTLKHTDDNGNVVYDDGDYYLNYNNLRNKLKNINNLNASNYSSLEVLSAYQGYLLQQNKLNRDGTQDMTGTLTALSINPKTTNSYDLGTKDLVWNTAFIKNPHVTGELYRGATTDTRYIYSGGTSTVYDIRAMAKDNYKADSMPNGSLVFCW